MVPESAQQLFYGLGRFHLDLFIIGWKITNDMQNHDFDEPILFFQFFQQIAFVIKVWFSYLCK